MVVESCHCRLIACMSFITGPLVLQLFFIFLQVFYFLQAHQPPDACVHMFWWLMVFVSRFCACMCCHVRLLQCWKHKGLGIPFKENNYTRAVLNQKYQIEYSNDVLVFILTCSFLFLDFWKWPHFRLSRGYFSYFSLVFHQSFSSLFSVAACLYYLSANTLRESISGIPLTDGPDYIRYFFISY